MLQETPEVTPGEPLVIEGIDIPAGANAMLIYETGVTVYAPLGEAAEITNTVTVTGACLPVEASATLPMTGSAALTISKSVSPEVVSGCGELTYTIVIQNSGSDPAAAEDEVVVTDVFDPVLHDLTVELDGEPLSAPADYTYDEAAGTFATVAGRITVPGATFTQNTDGTWVTDPGIAVLTVTGKL